MNYKKILAALVFMSFLFNCNETEVAPLKALIIPQPLEQLNSEGQFIIDNSTGINFNEIFKVSANFLKTYIEEGSEIKIKTNNNIVFIKDETITNNEGYSLEISSNSIKIKAKTDQGAFYAVQSLRQLLPPEFENGTFKGVEIPVSSTTINDEPQFTYRGMHLDVGRHMFSVNFIKKYIDALALLKMNTFHWRLTEDQGWRIEIKKYPKLQEIASYRNETLIVKSCDLS
jgi:hexosaminidase